MRFLEKEIEVEVGNPEVKRLRKLENKRRDCRARLSGVPIGPERIGNEESEHDRVNGCIDIELRLLEHVVDQEETLGVEDVNKDCSQASTQHEPRTCSSCLILYLRGLRREHRLPMK